MALELISSVLGVQIAVSAVFPVFVGLNCSTFGSLDDEVNLTGVMTGLKKSK